MRASRKRKVFAWCALALLLAALAFYLDYRFQLRATMSPVTADPYVPCPAGTRPQPDQRHICVPS